MNTVIPDEEREKLLDLPKNNFIKDYAVAVHIVDSAMASHKNYWEVIRACQDHINGKKPIPIAELEKKGLGWVYNFNYGKARAKIEKGTAESTAKISSALAMGYATLRDSTEDDRNDKILSFLLEEEKRGIVASAIGYSLCSTLAKETRLSGWLNEIEYPSYAFGYCALVRDKFDWIPTPVHPLDIAFKPDTKPDNIRTWITFDIMESSDLYDKWIAARNESVNNDPESNSKPKRISSSGWNLEGLESVLLRAFKGKLEGGRTPETWKEVVPLYNETPSMCILNTESVIVAKIFHKELDGSLSETYIPYQNAWQITKNKKPEAPQDNSNVVSHLLFSKNHGKYIQSKWIHIIRDSGFAVESGTIQSLKGIASYACEDGVRYNRQRNGLNNKAHFAGSPYFEQPNGQSVEKFKLTVSQGFIILPSSHRMVERQPTFDLSSHINILRFEEGEFTRDTQQYDATIQGRLTSRPNRGEVQRVTEEVEFTDNAKNNIKFRDYAAVFLSVLKNIHSVDCKDGDPGYEGRERFYNTLIRQLSWLIKTKEDADKILACIDSFVLEPVTSNVETITIAIQMAETPFARNRLKRMLLLAKGLPIEEVSLSIPMITDKFSNIGDARVAAIENDMFFTTNEVVISMGDDHIVHIESHTAKNDRIIKGVQSEAISPIDAFKYLENNLLHCIKHNELLGQNPVHNRKSQEFVPILESQMKAKNQIRSMAEQMLQQQQEQQQQIQIDPETQAKIASDAAKAQSDIARKDWLGEQRTEQSEKKMEQNFQLREREMQLEHEQKLAKIAANGQK